MPRKARIDAPGALHHVITRGIEKRDIFSDDRDRHSLIERLGTILQETTTRCYAWALLPNHFHLLLRSGGASISTVMRRLLTGHALYFNRRHHRTGHLFQNRYKSILCQEDPYFLELVRYIHLNPLRAGIADDMKALETYPFSGHAAVMGKQPHPWQDVPTVLSYFGNQTSWARRGYRAFVAKGVDQGRRPDLIGGGLIRSAGGWTAIQALRHSREHMKSDERILGDGDFVEATLSQSREALDRHHALKAQGVDLEYVVARTADVLSMEAHQIWLPGKARQQVAARSLVCYWAVRELGETMASMARRFNMSITAVSKSVSRGQKLAENNRYHLLK
jgi:REP element-mobilizing transposase RayT